jgi:hypothetical protein
MFLSCGCKNTMKEEKIVPQGITPIQVVQVSSTPLNYSIEEIIRAKDYLNARDKKELERDFVYQLLIRTGGPAIYGYCDLVCMKDVKNHIDKLDKQLQHG